MSLPFSQARRGPPTDVTTKGPPGTTSTARTSTSHSSNRPISTSSRGYSITSKNSLPEKQLLSRYRHVYAGKGGWFQGRTSAAPPANYTSGQSSRHLDVYRKELILRLSKDIFENSKQKLASADFVVSNKVAGDPSSDVHAVSTKLGDGANKTITSVESHSPQPTPTPRIQRDESARNYRTKTTPRQIKPTFYTLNSSRMREASASKNPLRINLRGGTTMGDQSTQKRLTATSAVAGYGSNQKSTVVKHSQAIDDLPNVVTAANEKPRDNQDVLSQEQTTNDRNCDPCLETVAEQKKPDNDPHANDLFSALNRSNTIHIESFKKRNIANTTHESTPGQTECSNAHSTQAKGINGELNGSEQNSNHTLKCTADRQSKCLTSEEGQRVKSLTESKQDHSKPHSSVKRSLENNPAEKNEANGSASKSAKRNKKSSSRIKKFEEKIDDILGEIQFNVLRQRSFIRLPKKVAKVLENERPVTRGENAGESRQLLSRMSLSKEAQDALQETRKEMKLETSVDLDKYDIRKLNSRGNKRPNSPKPESPKPDLSSGNSSRNSLSPDALLSASLQDTARNKSDKSFDGPGSAKMREKMKRRGSDKKLEIPSIQYTVDTSRERFNQTVDGLNRRGMGSRASTVATPITDLIPAIPKEQQDGYVRYSTHMSRDTPRTNQRMDNKTRRMTAGTITSNTRTQYLNVSNENKNGTTQNKKVKNTYTVPLKSSSEEITPAGGKKIPNGLTNDVESIKSDWESQLRAMSKYGLVTEKSFQITPPGWDERYKDLADKNNGKADKEVEVTLAEVKEKAIEKCSDWLQKYA